MLKKVPLLLFALACLVAVTIYSCKKDSQTNQQNTISDPAIAQAKTWYESAYPASNTKITTLGTGANTAFSQLINPDWQHAASYKRGNQPVLEIPINPSAKFTSALKNGTTNSLLYSPDYSRSSFLLLKDGESYKAYVMTVIADPAYLKNDLTKLDHNKYNKRDTDFTGAVLYSTPKGVFISGWFYNNGEIVNTIQPSNTPGKDTVKSNGLSIQNLHPDLAQVNCTDWYQVSEVDGTVVDVKYLGPICDYSGGSGSGPSAPPASPAPGGGGGNPTSSPKPKPSPCTIPNSVKVQVQSTEGHLVVDKNVVQPPPGDGDGTFPPPTTPPPAQSETCGVVDVTVTDETDITNNNPAIIKCYAILNCIASSDGQGAIVESVSGMVMAVLNGSSTTYLPDGTEDTWYTTLMNQSYSHSPYGFPTITLTWSATKVVRHTVTKPGESPVSTVVTKPISSTQMRSAVLR